MAKVSRSDTVGYVAKLLKAKPDMAYADVVKEGKKAGYHVYPLIMGLAKNKLGLGRKTKRGPGRPRGRRPGRPAGRPSSNGRVLTGELVRALSRMQSDSQAMHAALRDIAKLAGRF